VTLFVVVRGNRTNPGLVTAHAGRFARMHCEHELPGVGENSHIALEAHGPVRALFATLADSAVETGYCKLEPALSKAMKPVTERDMELVLEFATRHCCQALNIGDYGESDLDLLRSKISQADPELSRKLAAYSLAYRQSVDFYVSKDGERTALSSADYDKWRELVGIREQARNELVIEHQRAKSTR